MFYFKLTIIAILYLTPLSCSVNIVYVFIYYYISFKMSVIIDTSNLKDIINALKQGCFPSHRWSHLGLQLGLLQPTLSDIRAKYSNDPESCLQECLTLWLSKADNVTESGGPTWDSLASALNKLGENATADKIMEFGKEYLNEYPPMHLYT